MIWADVLLAQQSASRTYYELMRLRQLDQWWHWIVLAGGCLLIVAAVCRLYLIDARSLARGKRLLLLMLRLLAFGGLLLFFLDLQKRSEQKLVKNSRFAILVDASQSMGIADVPAAQNAPPIARVEPVAQALSSQDWVEALRRKHDVSVYRFDETNQPDELAAFLHHDSEDAETAGRPSTDAVLREVKAFWYAALGCFAFATLALMAHWILGHWVRTAEGDSWALLVGVFVGIVGLSLAAVANLRHPDIGPRIALGWEEPATATDPPAQDSTAGADAAELEPPQAASLDWRRLLEPSGGATRLGDALAWLLSRERGAPLAGVAVITDGNGNRGLEPLAAAALAAAADVPLYPIGIGSDQPPRNIRLVDLDAPARVYPGDEFKLTGYLQAYGSQGKQVRLRLLSRPDADDSAEPVLEADVSVELAEDGAVVAIPMPVTPQATGKRVYSLEVMDDEQDGERRDNVVSAKVQIVDRKSRVLLIAGGPTRDYRFLRNMLYRDRDVSVDILLQTAAEGISQEADEILFDLPMDPAELFEYDAIVAFDPNWLRFDQRQLELLEQWVAEKAGGLVVIAGPVNMALWAENRRAPAQIEIVRQLYPVTFNVSRVGLGRYESATAWPLEITEDGVSSSFLTIDDNELQPTEAWQSFPGIYGYYPVRDVKPAATVLARFSDPQTAMNDQQPPLIVSQFYGSGRVVFLGTGEFWRLRSLDEGYFERFYTKLIRYVSEGRLQRDSNRGLLLVDKNRAIRGDAIAIRASVVDQQFQPLSDPQINVVVRRPDGSTENLELGLADSARDGMYAGRLIVSQEGDYTLELVLPGDGEPVVLQREIRVRLPNLEIERPQRDDALLGQLAATTNGRYFIGMDSAISGDQTLAQTVVSKRRETYLPGTPDHAFQQRWMGWLLTLICGALSVEWLVRRLSKLA